MAIKIKKDIVAGILFSALIGSTSVVDAELFEIANYGGESTQRYFTRITQDDPQQNAPIGKPLSQAQIAHLAKQRFPIKSKQLKPGRVQSRRWDSARFMTTQMALLGYDRLSVKWLQKNKKKLEQEQIIIMVVNVQTQEQFNKIKAFLPNNTVQAMSGDDIARQLQISHYPVLINARGIEQ